MQRSLRISENQLLMLADKARHDNNLCGYLFKKSSDSTKWQMRWFVLYQNLLFYYEAESSPRPSGVIFLEGCYCERLITTGQSKLKEMPESQHCFAITYRQGGLRQYELCAKNEPDCNLWIDAIKQASFNELLLQKEELEQKYLHLLQIVESEKTGKWQYTQQCEELTMEINKMRTELSLIKRETTRRTSVAYSGCRRFSEIKAEDSDEIKKIKKVQSFFRGWLCRRRWKQIVEEYIHSPHAESMRKRNSLVFRLVEAEEEYLEQLELLVSCFLRPFKMAASSKKPPCTHDDVNSIFLNSETVMFLHQIFLKGLTARMENWPTLVLGDLFNMLLPMLCIYQEYVRNHHYSLQVLTECKQNPQFSAMLKRLEEKPSFNGRSLESFLTYPMHQIPRYIITIHELLAHTPHNHVERKSLDEARIKLEELSRQMHDEVSETENIRKNLAIERMIVEGCDILLDVNQVFVRQGSLIQIPSEKPKGQWNRISSFKSEKESVRQCFLFTNHMLLTTRSSGGRLHLVQGCGKISLADTMLIEDPSESCLQDDDGESSSGSVSSQSSEGGPQVVGGYKHNHHNHDFKLIVDVKGGAPMIVHLAASNEQEKAAWISDISHCMDNAHFNILLHNTNDDTSSVAMPQSIRNDPRLFKDDNDIRFSRTLNSCKVPQIRHASPKRLLERLTDLRFLSVDFLNTFMLTYRVFTDGITVLEALKKVYYNPDAREVPEDGTLEVVPYGPHGGDGGRLSVSSVISWEADCNYRRVSSVSCNSETTYDREREHSIGHASHFSTGSYGSHWKYTHRKYEEEQWRVPRDSLAPPSSGIFHTNTTTTIINAAGNATSSLFNVPTIPAVPSAAATMASLSSAPIDINMSATLTSSSSTAVNNKLSQSLPEEGKHLQVPNNLASSQSSETLTETAISAPSSPSSITTTSTSTHTLVPSGEDDTECAAKHAEVPIVQPPSITVPIPLPKPSKVHEPPPSPRTRSMMSSFLSSPLLGRKQKDSDHKQEKKDGKSTKDNIKDKVREMFSSPLSASGAALKTPTVVRISAPVNADEPNPPTTDSPLLDRHRRSTTSIASAPAFSLNGSHLYAKRTSTASSSKRGSGADTTDGSFYTPRGSFLSSIDSPQHTSKAGVVVTSSRPSQRRSSTSSAAAAFAVATAGCSNPRDQLSPPQRTTRFLSAGNTDARFSPAKRDSMMSSAATMRVLRVLRHWVSKHSQDFENSPELLKLTVEFLEELVNNVNLLPAEHKAATQLFQMITREDPNRSNVDLDILLAPPSVLNKENIETLSALEIAEQMTLLDHKIFVNMRCEEFLDQAWMKIDKATKAPNILLITKRFNDVSRLVVSEIIRRTNLASRIIVIEKWAAVADICRCLHNFNGVLQICAAFVNSSVFRLKKTWDKVSKTTKQTVDKLQTLVSSDCRFRNLREAMHRCDPPCIPYLGMYLTDLSFIEEGTPNFIFEDLLNFSKMRMIAHVIREIRMSQQTPYKIELSQKVANYLLDETLLIPDEDLYRMSLIIEPRQSRLSTTTLHGTHPGVIHDKWSKLEQCVGEVMASKKCYENVLSLFLTVS